MQWKNLSIQPFPVSLRLSLQLKTLCIIGTVRSVAHPTQHLLGMCHGNKPDPHRSERHLVQGQIRWRSYSACPTRSRVRVPGSWEGPLGRIIQEALPAGARKAWQVCLIASWCLSWSPFSLPSLSHLPEVRGNQQKETSQSCDCRGLRRRGGDRSDPQ